MNCLLKSHLFVLVVILIVLGVSGKRTKGPKWWRIGQVMSATSLSQNNVLSNSLVDHHLPTSAQKLLKKKQLRLIRRNSGLLPFVIQGVDMALQGCQSQMKDELWNCTTLPTRRVSPYGKLVSKPCRETAFVYALTSAAVLHAVTRGCTQGNIISCSCDADPQSNSVIDHLGKENSMATSSPSSRIGSWKWAGCSENVEFGFKLTKDFVDAGEKGRNPKSVMNLHNNRAGRLHVLYSMKVHCKCHGISGSCTYRTCWRSLPLFKQIGDGLKRKFEEASMVVPTEALLSIANDLRRSKRKKAHRWRRAKLNSESGPFRKVKAVNELIYLDESPNFCTRNRRLSIPGTKGRTCNATSFGSDSCDSMCCGRGFRTKTVEVLSRCSCTFQWCCEVACKTCTRRVLVHTCR